VFEESKIANGSQLSVILQIAYLKSLSIKDSDNLEDFCLKIMWNRAVKLRISVNNSSSSRITQNLKVTSHEEWFPKFHVSRKIKSANHASREYACTTLFEESKITNGCQHSILQIAYLKSLSIDDSDHLEDFCLKITWNRGVKSRISVNNSSSSRITQNLKVTSHEEWFPKFHVSRKIKSANHASLEYPCKTLLICQQNRDYVNQH